MATRTGLENITLREINQKEEHGGISLIRAELFFFLFPSFLKQHLNVAR